MKKMLIGCAIAVAMVGCGNKNSFEVRVESAELGTQLMTIVYTTNDGNRVVKTAPAVEGKFEFDGNATGRSVVEIFNSNKQLYLVLLAGRGEEISAKIDSDGSVTIEGSELSARLQELLKSYSDTIDYSGEDGSVMSVLVSIYGMGERADSGFFTSPELFVRNDSVATYDGEGYWFFSTSAEERKGAFIDSIREYNKKEIPVRDIWIGVDTLQWRSATKRDSADWVQAMAPDAPLRYQTILTSTPLMIETDSVGKIVRVQRFE